MKDISHGLLISGRRLRWNYGAKEIGAEIGSGDFAVRERFDLLAALGRNSTLSPLAHRHWANTQSHSQSHCFVLMKSDCFL